MLKNLLFEDRIEIFMTTSYAFSYNSIETTILTNEKNSSVKEGNCIFGEFLKLYLQNSFEENPKIIL